MTNKFTYSMLLFCVICTSCLVAQRPIYTTRLFYPPDTSISFFTLSEANRQPIMLADSSFVLSGTSTTGRFLTRLDKQGNWLWSRSFRNDSLIAILNFAVSPDGGILMTGLYDKPQGVNSRPLLLAKLDANGTPQWSRVYNLPGQNDLIPSFGITSSVNISKSGNILITGVVGRNDSWYSYFLLTNASGVVKKATTCGTTRPSVTVTREGGFVVGFASARELIYGFTENLSLMWLSQEGDSLRSAYYSPLVGTNLGFISYGLAPLALSDSGLVMIHGTTLSRIAKDGTIMWSKRRAFQTTQGINFNQNASLSTTALMVATDNKIYTASGLFETNLGTGREIPVINIYDMNGNGQSLAYTNQNSRISSFIEIANNSGFWMTADTIIPRSVNTVKTITSRIMRTDRAFNAGCGAPLSLNMVSLDGNIQRSQWLGFYETPFVTADYTPTNSTTVVPVSILTKGECPTSIVRSDDLDLPIMKVYPNPSTGDFTIESEAASIKSIRVFDVASRLILTKQNSLSSVFFTIDQAGTYFLHIETTKGQIIKKIVKMD